MRKIVRFNLYIAIFIVFATVAISCDYDSSRFDTTPDKPNKPNAQCTEDKQRCDEQCVAKNDRNHCGTCNQVCSLGCEDTGNSFECSCAFKCQGTEKCIDNPERAGDKICQCQGEDGEPITDFRYNPKNCGFCGNMCLEKTTCTNGHCLCSNGKTQCEANGECNIDTMTDVKHCGSCTVSCANNETCYQGHCCETFEDKK